MILKDFIGRSQKVTNLENSKKWRHHFANKGLYSQSYGFPVVISGCESWTIKKPEHQRIDALNCEKNF